MTKEQIGQRARLIKQEIEQIFIDAEHWNTAVRRIDEVPIDPDPDGNMRKVLRSIDRILLEPPEEQ